MEREFNGTKLSLKVGDITVEDSDAIVNAANSGLVGGGGVDGAIHRAGGPTIMEECRKFGGCPTGSAVITSGGELRAKYVIHAVGPIYRGSGGGEANKLSSAYRKCLELADEAGLKSISFPSISTGAYGYPIDEAAGVALATIRDYIEGGTGLLLVNFVLFSERDYGRYSAALEKL